tara:strand:- start:531 stop:770 length:240 start_codon:yes stop_codon:yes gene_type:complete
VGHFVSGLIAICAITTLIAASLLTLLFQTEAGKAMFDALPRAVLDLADHAFEKVFAAIIAMMLAAALFLFCLIVLRTSR